MASKPILIVGAGPSGLVLALTLLKNGVPVRIIDKESSPRLGERGSGLQPRSLELHKILGTLPDILNVGTKLPAMTVYDPADGNKIMKTIVLIPDLEATPQIPLINPAMLGQHYQESILRSHLENMGAKVEFGSELRSFRQFEDHIIAEIISRADGKEVVEEVKVPWLVGVDGAHSIVRKTIGLEFLGETRHAEEIILADIKVKGDIRKTWDNWGNPTSRIASMRPSGQPDHIVQLVIAGRDVDATRILNNREALIEEFYDITGRREIIFEDLVWVSQYRPNIRMVKQVRSGNVFIGGDAAHCHSPAGGQGLNSSIQDSFNLGWKLGLVYKGYAPASLLDTYGEERIPIIAEMLGKTTELHNQVITQGGQTAPREGIMKQLGVNYRGSSIVYEDDVEVSTEKTLGYSVESETAARPGDRAPGVPGLIDIVDAQPLAIYDLFTASRHTILIFSDPSFDYKSLRDNVQRFPKDAILTVVVLPKGTSLPLQGPSAIATALFDKTVLDNDGYAFSGYHVEGPSIAIVRPDGAIGARVRGTAGVEKYFRGIFL